MYNSPEKIGNQIRNERMKRKIAIKYISEYSDDILEDIHIRNIEEGKTIDINVLCICIYSLYCEIEFVDYKYVRLYNIVNRFIRFKNRNKKENDYSLILKNKLKDERIRNYFEGSDIEDLKSRIDRILCNKMYNKLKPVQIENIAEIKLNEFISLKDGKYNLNTYHLCKICNALNIMIYIYSKYDNHVSLSEIKKIIHNFYSALFYIFSLAFLIFSIWVFSLDNTITIDLFIFSFDTKVKFLYTFVFILACFILRYVENKYIRK